MADADISTSTVLRTVIALTWHDHWPTIADIASHLRCDEETVRKLLLELRRRRTVKDRQRKGKRVWMLYDNPG